MNDVLGGGQTKPRLVSACGRARPVPLLPDRDCATELAMTTGLVKFDLALYFGPGVAIALPAWRLQGRLS